MLRREERVGIESHERFPRSCLTNESIHAFRKHDRQITFDEIWSEMGIIYESVVFSNHLASRQTSAEVVDRK